MGSVIEHRVGGYERDVRAGPEFGQSTDTGAVVAPIRIPRREIERRVLAECLLDATKLRFKIA